MYPSDEWLEVLQFYLIVASGGRLTLLDFTDAELQAAWQEQPGTTYPALVPVAEKLVLEFQAKQKDTEAKDSPIGDEVARLPLLGEGRGQNYEELPNGPVSVPMLGV